MAAGAGTRMKSQTPKVLHMLSGRRLIDYPILAAQSVSDDVQVVLFHQREQVEAHIAKSFDGVRCVCQDHENLPGTAGAVMAAKPKYDRVVVLNGDMPLVTPEFTRLLANRTEEAAISVFATANPSGYGRVVMSKDRVRRIVEEKDASEEEKKINIVNAGVYSFSKQFLSEFLKKVENSNEQKEFYLTDLISLAVKNKKTVSALWGDELILMGINSKADLSAAERIHQGLIKNDLMNRGILVRMPETVFIDASATFEGECAVENGAMILGQSRIVRSVIKAHSIVEDSIIVDSDIGPMAHIRPNSEIINTHIGNFVETKKAKLNGVKAGHLSYLGDATIDEGTNIGAGTITCNYNGKNKYQTTIGKNVFIGSDTQLVAPIAIPDNVLIGAGSTVVKDPKEGDLVLSRSEQKSIAGFFFKFFGKHK
ncbi:MAG: bifunctional UDP-N-acetylglucosamine diphosphorylase/glucosamine-1-phosphate N-acetyltransferase GlmU [Helicobacteraceae bacterium]|jgi:bifunctional UDP-N-acetylglucosamine pyrophosphorylase/glucosamine-1-phosphate N-acetyltransferase|nr:bifunctional UDP-N-acetylglucosamine diphosphorylase/glucosamine-1-phosphate N-acetyltransferase GlmU [Helicobacteraceae bacterium]